MAEATSKTHNLLKSSITGGIIFGILLGVAFGLTGITFFGLAGIFGIFTGIVIGLAVGAALGALYSIMPPWVSTPLLVILIFSAIAGLLILAWIWIQAGAFQAFFSPLGISFERIAVGIEKGVKCARDPVECLFKPFYDWSEPTVTENAEEEVIVNVDFSDTRKAFFSSEPIAVTAALVVKNPFQDYYIIEPKCFLNGEEMELKESPRLQGGVIEFRKSEIEQRASVTCEKKSGVKLEGDKDVNSSRFEMRLIKRIVAKAEWNVYTLSQEVLFSTENPFEDVAEPNLKGRRVLSKMEYASPLKLSIGSNDDQPFYEEKWPFSIILRKEDEFGKVIDVSRLELEAPPGGIVTIAQPCEFESSGSRIYTFNPSKLSRATDILNKKNVPIPFECSLVVSNLNPDQTLPQRTVVRAEVEFDYENVFTAPILIFSELEREKV